MFCFYPRQKFKKRVSQKIVGQKTIDLVIGSRRWTICRSGQSIRLVGLMDFPRLADEFLTWKSCEVKKCQGNLPKIFWYSKVRDFNSSFTLMTHFKCQRPWLQKFFLWWMCVVFSFRKWEDMVLERSKLPDYSLLFLGWQDESESLTLIWIKVRISKTSKAQGVHLLHEVMHQNAAWRVLSFLSREKMG